MAPVLNKGVFLLSLDTELAWGGVHDGSYRARQELFGHTRDAIGKLVGLLERYDIRATWAVVGHLFLDRCEPINGMKHPEIVRPAYRWSDGDWFQNDPCTNAAAAPFWYAPDVVETVLGCRTPQEVGCHGFSHMIVGDPGCSAECFESEIKACQAAAARWGIALRSFVFPRNAVGHLDVLRKMGFVAFRGTSGGWPERLPSPIRRLGSGLQNVFPLPPLTDRPRRAGGLWDLPGTCFYLHRQGWARRVPVALRVRKALLGIEEAVERQSMFHLWFHPFNLASDPEGLLKGLETIFQEVTRYRESNQLTNPTMGELASQLNLTVQIGKAERIYEQ